jgi:hypothetical protein
LDEHQTIRIKDWEKNFMARQAIETKCSYCGVPIARTQDDSHWKLAVDFLIPIHLGGANHPKNLVLCCLPCISKKAGEDWIEWKGSVSTNNHDYLASLRMESLEESLNHVIPLNVRINKAPRKNAKSYIEKRWAHPRFKVYATVALDGGWFAIRSINNNVRVPLQTRLLFNQIISKNSGVKVELKGWRIYKVPFATFHETAFCLIELNALIFPVGRIYNPRMISPEHHRRWFMHLKGFEWIQSVVDSANELKLARSYSRQQTKGVDARRVAEEKRVSEILAHEIKIRRGSFNV